MTLSEYVARKKRELLSNLESGVPPTEGSYDPRVLADAKLKGRPQLGATVFSPSTIALEFIYSDGRTTPTILTIVLPAPERIVFLPVPPWVIEDIWQGSVDGAYHFESDALRLYENFGKELSEQGNLKWFEKAAPKRRE